MTGLDWAAVAVFTIVGLTIFFPWIGIYVEFMGDGRSMSASAAVSHVPFFAFLTFLGCAAVVAGTLLKQKSPWLALARFGGAALVLLALVIGVAVGIAYPTSSDNSVQAARIVGDVIAYPSGLWVLAFLLALVGAGLLAFAAFRGGFAEIKTLLNNRSKPAEPAA